MQDTNNLKPGEEGENVHPTLLKRSIRYSLSNIVEGLSILLLIGLIVYFGQMLVSIVRPAIIWLSSVIGINIQQQALVIIGSLVVGSYLLGYISKRKHLAKKIGKHIPIVRNMVSNKIHDGLPCLIIPNDETYIQAIYRGGQLIEIIGKNPKKHLTSRIAFPTYPIPVSGSAHFIGQGWVYIVTNVSLREWTTNDITALAREIKPSIQVMPISEYLEKHSSKKRHA